MCAAGESHLLPDAPGQGQIHLAGAFHLKQKEPHAHRFGDHLRTRGPKTAVVAGRGKCLASEQIRREIT